MEDWIRSRPKRNNKSYCKNSITIYFKSFFCKPSGSCISFKWNTKFITERSKAFQERRDFVVSELNKIEGINCLKPEGAFYVFPSCKNLLGKKDKKENVLKTDTDFVQSMLENAGVAVVQGSAFGLDGFFRISYATSMENLKKALIKISDFCKSIK